MGSKEARKALLYKLSWPSCPLLFSAEQIMSKERSSFFKGVFFNNTHKKWVSHLKIIGKKRVLGYKNTEEEAALLQDIALLYCTKSSV